MPTREEIQRTIRRIELANTGNIATDEQLEALPGLRAQLASMGTEILEVASDRPGGLNGPTPADDEFLNLDTDSYKRGGETFTPPKAEAIYDAICEGWMRPSRAPDQIWFLFRSLDGAADFFRGSLVCGALTARNEASGAWKVLQVVKALGVEDAIEVVEGRGIRGLNAVRGKRCKVDWRTTEYTERSTGTRKREMRIQDVFATTAQIGQSI